MASLRRFAVGDRVTHLDLLAQAERRLPMEGTIVAEQVTYLVEWDGAEDRLWSDGKKTHSYDPEVLLPLEPA